MSVYSDGSGPPAVVSQAGGVCEATVRSALEPFRVEVHADRETVRVAPVGELDLATVDRLRERLDELREVGFSSLVLDLRALTFTDSSGLHLALDWDTVAREHGLGFALIQGPRQVRRAFEVVGLLDRLPFCRIGARKDDAASAGVKG